LAKRRVSVEEPTGLERPVLIDATNPFVETSPTLVLADLGGKGASEVVAALAPGARIVKAFNRSSPPASMKGR